MAQPTYPPPVYYPPPAYPPPGYAPPQYAPPPPPPPAYAPPPPDPVVSVYVDPPMEQPAPVGVPWAPPPMLVEDPGPPPFYGATWTGGYWVWEGQWVWAHGRWLPPPAGGYMWTQPYYEHRDTEVVFIPGYWRAPDAVFVPPPPTMTVVVVAARPGVPMGPPPQGPNGVFVPPPPGSRPGIIVPAPIGTSPAVVAGSPPVVRPGMQIHPGDEGHVRIDAPGSAMANGQALNATAPSVAHLAAAQAPVVRVAAPPPASNTPIRSYSPQQGFAALPPARAVNAVVAQPAQLQRAPAGQPLRPAAPPPAFSNERAPVPAPSPAERASPPPGFEQPPRVPEQRQVQERSVRLPQHPAAGNPPPPPRPPAASPPAEKKETPAPKKNEKAEKGEHHE